MAVISSKQITTSSLALTGSLFGTASYTMTASSAPNYLPLTGGTILGNLSVIGTASFTYTTASIVQVGTSTILLNTDNPATRFGGITVVDSGSFGNSSTGSIFWDSLNNRWIYSNPSGSSYDGGMLISGPRNTSGLGNEAGMDANYIAVGQGADHIRPGSIYNSGSLTIVTGSLIISGSAQGNPQAQTVSSNTASIDLSSNNFFTVQLVSGSNVHINPTNIRPGQTATIRVNATGSGTVSFPSTVKQASGSNYVATTGSGAFVDVLSMITYDSSVVYLVGIKNFV